MALTYRNQLATPLVVDNAVFGPAGSSTQDQTFARRTLAVDAAIEAEQIEYVSGVANPGDIAVLDEVVATGVEQSLAHGLDHVPSAVGLLVTYVPDTGYGGGSGKPYEIQMGTHTDTHLKVTVTAGLKFQPLVLA